MAPCPGRTAAGGPASAPSLGCGPRVAGAPRGVLRPLKGCLPLPSRTPAHAWPTAHVRAAKRSAAGLAEGAMTRSGRAMGAKSFRDCLPAFSTAKWPMLRRSPRPTIRNFTAVSSAIRPSLRRGRGIPACPSAAPSRPACSSPILSSWDRSTKAPGRRRPTQVRGSTAACAKRSGCRRRKHASARRRTTLPRCRGPGRSISRAPARSTACRPCPRAGSSACRSSPRRRACRSAPQQPWLAWAELKNRSPAPARPVSAPEPRPAPRLRPRQLSVTDVEKWLANPYAIFAARILGLERLPGFNARPPDAALRGQIVHEALSRFARRFPDRAARRSRRHLGPRRRPPWSTSRARPASPPFGRRGWNASRPGLPRPSRRADAPSPRVMPSSTGRSCWPRPVGPLR